MLMVAVIYAVTLSQSDGPELNEEEPHLYPVVASPDLSGRSNLVAGQGIASLHSQLH
jgi:hypothetical protein